MDSATNLNPILYGDISDRIVARDSTKKSFEEVPTIKIKKIAVGYPKETDWDFARQQTSWILYGPIKIINAYPSLIYNSNTIENEKLKLIMNLENNWDGFGANPFSVHLLLKCQRILDSLSHEPKIFPTARSSVQFEYEDESGTYLEIEIFIDSISIYAIDNNNNEHEFLNCTENEINEFVEKFYSS